MTPRAAPMAKKRADEEPKAYGLAIRGSKEWHAWVMRLAKFRRLKATDLMDQALVEYARSHGFQEEAPDRVP